MDTVYKNTVVLEAVLQKKKHHFFPPTTRSQLFYNKHVDYTFLKIYLPAGSAQQFLKKLIIFFQRVTESFQVCPYVTKAFDYSQDGGQYCYTFYVPLTDINGTEYTWAQPKEYYTEIALMWRFLYWEMRQLSSTAEHLPVWTSEGHWVRRHYQL